MDVSGRKLRDYWIDGSDVGRGGSTSGSGAARQPVLNKDEERKRAAKKRQEAIMQQMKAQRAGFASIFFLVMRWMMIPMATLLEAMEMNVLVVICLSFVAI